MQEFDSGCESDEMTTRLIRNFNTCRCNCIINALSRNSVPSLASALSRGLSTAPNTTKPFFDASQRPARPTSPQTDFYRRKLPNCCTSFCSNEGKTIFKEALLSGHLECYFSLSPQFKTQEEPAYCGLSTLVMVLNTLEVDPKRVWKGPWRWYHEDMLDCCIPLDVIEKKGITMDQFACLAACNMLQIKMVRADESISEDKFRDLIRDVTKRTDQVLVTSYSRIALDQTGDGHYSPIGGYNPDRDMVLIMDTARFKYPPHWVPLPLLFKAMKLIDPTSGLPRGYFILSKNQFNPGLLFRLSSFFSPLGMDCKLESFFNAWEKLLATELMSSDLIGSDVAELTIVEVIRLLGEIQDDVHLLTVQLDTKFAEEVSYHYYSQNVIQMVSSLESLPFFSIVCSRIPQISPQVLSHAGCLSNISTFDDMPKIEDLKNTFSSLTSAHFLAVFMLSWPYHRCRPETFGSALHKFISSQLSRPDTELLQNECARIRQQLTSINTYAKKCSKICCT